MRMVASRSGISLDGSVLAVRGSICLHARLSCAARPWAGAPVRRQRRSWAGRVRHALRPTINYRRRLSHVEEAKHCSRRCCLELESARPRCSRPRLATLCTRRSARFLAAASMPRDRPAGASHRPREARRAGACAVLVDPRPCRKTAIRRSATDARRGGREDNGRTHGRLRPHAPASGARARAVQHGPRARRSPVMPGAPRRTHRTRPSAAAARRHTRRVPWPLRRGAEGRSHPDAAGRASAARQRARSEPTNSAAPSSPE